MAEWLKATDCKSVLARVRWFESTSAQTFIKRIVTRLRPMSKIKARCAEQKTNDEFGFCEDLRLATWKFLISSEASKQ